MGMRTQINRALIAAHAYFEAHKKGNVKNKTVLIVFQQIFGDSIVIQNSLSEYTKIFPKAEGYDVRFLVRPSVLAFMKATMPLPEDITFEAVDFKRYLEDYRYFKEVVQKYRNTAGTVIVPGTSFSAEIFAVTNNACRKIGLIRSIDVTKPWVMAYFYRKAYTETVRPEKEDMMLIRHRKIINYLYENTDGTEAHAEGRTQGRAVDYRASLPKLLPKERIVDGSYAVMCLGASKMEKCWPIERFAEVADYIIEKYGLPIHLCGGKKKSRLQIR